MNFMEAIEAMKQGKKVRLPEWGYFCYHYYDFNRYAIMQHQSNWSEDKVAEMVIENIQSKDWEIYEEPKKSLWDKKKYFEDDAGEDYFYESNVKQALKEFVDLIQAVYEIHDGETSILDKAKEIFGEEMLRK